MPASPRASASRPSRGAFDGCCATGPAGSSSEDLHWADRASVDLITFLWTELDAERIFFVATSRPDGIPAELAGRMRGALHTVHLGPLEQRRITTILRQALRGRGSLGADRVRRVAELAGGNPLFGLELLREALAGGDDGRAPSLAHPFLRRLARLDATVREVVEVGSPWLGRVARNRAIDALRARAVRDRAGAPARLAPPAPEPPDAALAALDVEHVRRALGQLAPHQRELIELGFFRDCSHSDIASLTALPLGTVKTPMRASLQRLRRELTPLLRA